MSKKRRDSKGRFLPGNGGSPGRKKRTTERAYMDALLGATPINKWQEVVRTAVQQAIDGDHQARKWLSEYVIGRPPQMLEIKGADAIMLEKLLHAIKQQGLTAGDLFEAMLQEVAQQAVLQDDEEDDDDV